MDIGPLTIEMPPTPADVQFYEGLRCLRTIPESPQLLLPQITTETFAGGATFD
jgi:hypothetical protein